MAFRLAAAARVCRHDPKTTLARRPEEALPFAGTTAETGNGLLLDTRVYIDNMQGRAPPVLADLIVIRNVHHSAVAVQELLHTVGVLDPDDPRSETAIDAIGRAVDAMPPHHLFTPDLDTLAAAAVYAGILCRNQGYAKDDKTRALHDCTLFVQAMRLGLTVLTRNVRDFDVLLQMRPTGRVLFYR